MPKPRISWLSVLWLSSVMLLLAVTTLSAATIKVGLVTDVGRVNDRSFNQSAWEGVELAKSNLGLGDRDIKYIETQEKHRFESEVSITRVV